MSAKPSSEEMTATRDRLQAVAEELTNLIDDAICLSNRQQADKALSDATKKFERLRQELANAPYISVDLSEVEQEISALIEVQKKKLPPFANPGISFETYSKALKRSSERHDHLGAAAKLSSDAREAKKAGNFDEAWRCNELAKEQYLLHAQSQGWGPSNTMRLVGSLHGFSADILRLGGRHVEALRHYLYYSVHSAKPSKSQVQKLGAYIKRSKLPGATPLSAMAFLDTTSEETDFNEIDKLISSWRETSS